MADGILQRERGGGIQYHDLVNGGSNFINPAARNTVDFGLYERFQSLDKASGGQAGSAISFVGHLGDYAFGTKFLGRMLGPVGIVADIGMRISDENGFTIWNAHLGFASVKAGEHLPETDRHAARRQRGRRWPVLPALRDGDGSGQPSSAYLE